MPANTNPIFPLTPQIGWTTLTTGNTATDGTGTVATLFTATTDGSRVDYLRCVPLGSNVPTVLRVFLNNGSTNATATNNSLFYELPLPETSASNVSENGGEYDVSLNISLPNGYKVNVVIGTTVSAGWKVTAIGGNY